MIEELFCLTNPMKLIWLKTIEQNRFREEIRNQGDHVINRDDGTYSLNHVYDQ